MDFKKYIIPNKRNLILTFVLLIIFLVVWWYDTNKLMVYDGGPTPLLSKVLIFSIILPLGLVFVSIYPWGAYLNAILHLHTWQFIAALIAEIVYLYFLSCLILWAWDKLMQKIKNKS